MRKISIIITALLFGMFVHAQQNVTIIPKPMSLVVLKGNFVLDQNTQLVNSAKNKQTDGAIVFFMEYLKKNNGIDIQNTKAKGTKIVFKLEEISTIGDEGYVLDVTPTEIVVKANSPKGHFYAVQSLIQLVPVNKSTTVQIPCLTAIDYPRFGWRGMMLDCSRHFWKVDMVKQYIDLLAAYKMNTLHWHLTDDQGWRIEIKKYPKLTEIGGTRNGTIIGHFPGTGSDNVPVQGYYTQEQVKEIVAYAAQRNVMVIPEIEMPGHSSAAIAAYPELSCFPTEKTNFKDDKVANKTLEEAKNGRLKFVQETFGVFDDVYAPTEYTFKFLQDVLDEVMPLFPSKYIHIGGDECPKNSWKRSEFCQNLIKEKGLKNEHELQSYFIQRMEKYINSKGKTIIGWDEILEGGLAPNAAVMSWRGEKGGIEAAKMGHYVVMTPNGPLYFDHYQGDPETEPLAIGGFNTLKKVYAYEPIPAELDENDAKYILGSQANVWTEYIPTESQLQYMILPRMLALSEAVWSPKGQRNWDDFYSRLQPHLEGFKKRGINYSNGNLKVTIKTVAQAKGILIKLTSEKPDGVIYYTTDGSNPTTSSNKYEKPFQISSSLTVKAALAINGVFPQMKPAEQSIIFNKAIGKKVSYNVPPSVYYPANGEVTLTDGIRGTKEVGKNWHAFEGKDVVVTVDLGESVTSKKIAIGTIQKYNDWIFLPKSVRFEVSEDGKTFKEVQTVENTIPATEQKDTLKDFVAEFPAQNFKKVRITLLSMGNCPKGHSGEGQPGWIFTDEVIVE